MTCLICAERAAIVREERARGDSESARRQKAEAENARLRELLRRSLDVISPYDTTLWPEIHRAVHPPPSTKP